MKTKEDFIKKVTEIKFHNIALLDKLEEVLSKRNALKTNTAKMIVFKD